MLGAWLAYPKPALFCWHPARGARGYKPSPEVHGIGILDPPHVGSGSMRKIEIRQDLLADQRGQEAWAARLAGVFSEALSVA